ncbi:tyrosine-type recombinase/integrase [Paenibacillus shenyangensis]|uniref:tyrosine-type recombinase/integrase n=1 Tax=Paenibacillus sp. A9 TaxID=1284352 RepID=UPI00038053D2|nr:site-specific integrase [Paenibacillus sp. A9]
MATFHKLPSCKWQARVSRDGKEQSIGTFRSKKEAEIEAHRVEERIYYGHILNQPHLLFEEMVDSWFRHKQNELKYSSAEQLEVTSRLHILPRFGNMKLSKICRLDVKEWIQDCVDQGYASKTCDKYLGTLKSIFHFCIHDLEILEKNPADRLRVPIKDAVDSNRKVKYFTYNELHQLLEFMKQYKPKRFKNYPLYYTLMLFLSRSGLRISEALALCWDDLSCNRLTIERQTNRDKNNLLTITSLKSYSSYRTIQLDDDLLYYLEQFKEIQKKIVLNPHGDNLIFQNGWGQYLMPLVVREAFESYCKQVGVEYKGTHGFRHTHAVLLLESGASLLYVSRRLGHRTIKTTTDTYLSITKKIVICSFRYAYPIITYVASLAYD